MYEISGSGLEDREDNVEIMKGNRNYGIDGIVNGTVIYRFIIRSFSRFCSRYLK